MNAIERLRDHERSQWAVVSAQAPHRERIESARRFDDALAAVDALYQEMQEAKSAFGYIATHAEGAITRHDHIASYARNCEARAAAAVRRVEGD